MPCFSLGRKQFPMIDQIFERLMRNPHQVDEEEKTEASIIIPADEEKSFHLYDEPPSLKPIMGSTK